mgnify:CR=1 FL=1
MIKNPNRLLKKARTFVNKNIREIINNQPNSIIPPVPKKFLPSYTFLRDYYNQAYYCHYAALIDASLALSCICLEKISRDIYRKLIGDPPENWNQILEQLIKYFNDNKNLKDSDAFLTFLKDVKERKDRIRNLLLHGKIDEFIQDTIFEHNALNILTQKYEKIQINYHEGIHGKDKGKIKNEKVNLMSHHTLILLSIAIIRFNEYIDLTKVNYGDSP